MSDPVIIALITVGGVVGSAIVAGAVALYVKVDATHEAVNSGLTVRLAEAAQLGYLRGKIDGKAEAVAEAVAEASVVKKV